MLQSVLPGLRHVRTPLIVGGLYIFAAWLWLRGRLGFSLDGDTVAEESIASAVSRLGPTATTAALAASAVLVGSLLSLGRIPEWVWKRGPLEATSDDLKSWLAGKFSIAKYYSTQQLHDFQGMPEAVTKAMQSAQEKKDSEAIDVDKLAEALEPLVRGEADLLATRLRIHTPSLFDEVDRLRSEAELRTSIFFPMIAVISYFGTEWRHGAWIALVFPVALAIQGEFQSRAADAKVLSAVTHGAVSSPTTERFERFLDSEEPKVAAVPESEQRRYEAQRSRGNLRDWIEDQSSASSEAGLASSTMALVRHHLQAYEVTYDPDAKVMTAFVEKGNAPSPERFQLARGMALTRGYELALKTIDVSPLNE